VDPSPLSSVIAGRVSVIIPVFNGERYLEQAVKSAIAARWNDTEILIVDDGSTDATPLIAQRLRAEHPDLIRVLNHPGNNNRGVSASRNLAARAATGEFLAFLDADDLFLPDHLQCAIRGLEQDPTLAFAYSRVRIVDETEPGLGSRPTEWGRGPQRGKLEHCVDQLLEANFIPASSVVFRTGVFRDLGGFDESLQSQVEDYVLWTKCSAIHPIYYTDASTVEYRVHIASYSGQHANGVFASRSEVEYLSRVVPWLRAHAGVSENRLRQATSDVASRILYRGYVAARSGNVRALMRELLALGQVRPRGALVGGLVLWLRRRRSARREMAA
jgi:glycosyltransferase involved in cell wall biosynthesis